MLEEEEELPGVPEEEEEPPASVEEELPTSWCEGRGVVRLIGEGNHT
jgi:hypothetical protein